MRCQFLSSISHFSPDPFANNIIIWWYKITARINRRTKPCQGYETMNTIRKGQLQGMAKGDVRGHIALVNKLFGESA
jgi:hypothetical protein